VYADCTRPGHAPILYKELRKLKLRPIFGLRAGRYPLTDRGGTTTIQAICASVYWEPRIRLSRKPVN
jgi:hypothetical protein